VIAPDKWTVLIFARLAKEKPYWRDHDFGQIKNPSVARLRISSSRLKMILPSSQVNKAYCRSTPRCDFQDGRQSDSHSCAPDNSADDHRHRHACRAGSPGAGAHLMRLLRREALSCRITPAADPSFNSAANFLTFRSAPTLADGIDGKPTATFQSPLIDQIIQFLRSLTYRLDYHIRQDSRVSSSPIAMPTSILRNLCLNFIYFVKI
jgi:hypothetical protein